MNIEQLRFEIDKVDDELLAVLSKRKDIIQLIAAYKLEYHMNINDPLREKQLLSRLLKKAKEKDLDQEFITELYNIIIKYSRKEQEKK